MSKQIKPPIISNEIPMSQNIGYSSDDRARIYNAIVKLQNYQYQLDRQFRPIEVSIYL